MEGTRPIVAEIQALVTQTAFPAPRRTSNGIDYNRTCLILAVLEKRLGLKFSSNDVYLNVIGGLQIDEPASDLGIAMALVSSLTDKKIPDTLIAIGEIGLAGECRTVSNVEQRVKEAARRGFTEITVVGGLSGRLDHTFANLQMLAYGASKGLEITVTDGENEAFLLRPGKITLPKKEGFSLSVFSYGEKASGISLCGVKYPIKNGELTNLFPLGLSNEITEEEAEVSFTEGLLLIIISKLNEQS
jgi:hypothetical protein